MDAEDQSDIIKKVETSGFNDGENEEVPSNDQPEETPEEVPADDADNTFDEEPTDSLDEMGLGDHRVKDLLAIYDKGSDSVKKILTRMVSFTNKVNRDEFIKDVQEDVDPDDMDFIFGKINALGIPIPSAVVTEEESIFLKEPVRNNMFQKGSNDKLEETEEITEENLQSGEKLSRFVDNGQETANLTESFNDDMTQPTVEPTIKPKVKPDTKPIEPNRRNRHFLPNVTPDVRPAPKAVKEEPTVDAKAGRAEKKKKINYPVYHNTFSSAVQAARAFADAKGYTIEDGEWDFRVTTGPAKPSVGRTNRYSLELVRNGVVQRKMLHIQVYGLDNSYELNAYIN